MKKAFINGLAVGALTAAAISYMDDEMNFFLKKGKKFIKKKLNAMF